MQIMRTLVLIRAYAWRTLTSLANSRFTLRLNSCRHKPHMAANAES